MGDPTQHCIRTRWRGWRGGHKLLHDDGDHSLMRLPVKGSHVQSMHGEPGRTLRELGSTTALRAISNGLAVVATVCQAAKHRNGMRHAPRMLNYRCRRVCACVRLQCA